MLALLVLLVSSLMLDLGLQRSSFNGLHRLRQVGDDDDRGSNDSSSESIEPIKNKQTKLIRIFTYRHYTLFIVIKLAILRVFIVAITPIELNYGYLI